MLVYESDRMFARARPRWRCRRRELRRCPMRLGATLVTRIMLVGVIPNSLRDFGTLRRVLGGGAGGFGRGGHVGHRRTRNVDSSHGPITSTWVTLGTISASARFDTVSLNAPSHEHSRSLPTFVDCRRRPSRRTTDRVRMAPAPGALSRPDARPGPARTTGVRARACTRLGSLPVTVVGARPSHNARRRPQFP
jgi:hypothetical protein